MCQGFICCSVLTRQGSNLDSSEPKSDVLPITPRVRVSKCPAKIAYFFQTAKTIPKGIRES